MPIHLLGSSRGNSIVTMIHCMVISSLVSCSYASHGFYYITKLMRLHVPLYYRTIPQLKGASQKNSSKE
ncbi:MAG: hypothetical protein NT166_21640 [Candidatus Aminicenantes bacterium]|nr:hypothetical protein [Candidatus Aminicenantes bacterium]